MRNKEKIILVRHGTTDYNDKRLLQGWKDIPLNENGKANVLNTLHIIETLSPEWDVVVASDLLRAKETGEIIAHYFEIPLFHFPPLRERCYGKYEGMNIRYVKQLRKHDDLIEEYGGETKEKFNDRILEAMSVIETFFYKKRIIIVTHGAFIKNYVNTVNMIKCDKIENGAIYDVREKVFI